jgi:hypothetical protein
MKYTVTFRHTQTRATQDIVVDALSAAAAIGQARALLYADMQPKSAYLVWGVETVVCDEP